MKRLDNVNADILRAGGNLNFFAQRIVIFEGARLKKEILEISGKIHDLGIEMSRRLKENK